MHSFLLSRCNPTQRLFRGGGGGRPSCCRGPGESQKTSAQRRERGQSHGSGVGRLVGSPWSVARVSGEEGTVLGSSRHSSSCRQPVRTRSAEQSIPPRLSPSWCLAAQGALSLKSAARRRERCRPLPSHPCKPQQQLSQVWGGFRGAGSLGWWATSPSILSRSSVSLREPPQSPSLRRAGSRMALEGGWSSLPRRCFPGGGAKLKPNVSTESASSAPGSSPGRRRAWDDHASRGLGRWGWWPCSNPLFVPPTTSRCPKYPGEQSAGVAALSVRSCRRCWRMPGGRRGCCEQATVWQP